MIVDILPPGLRGFLSTIICGRREQRRRQATGGQARQNYSRPIAEGQTAAVRYATDAYVG